MKKTYPLRASLLILVLALAASPFARAQTALATGRAALAQQTPAALETAHKAFKTGLLVPENQNNAELNFFYAATLLAREVHTESFKDQFKSLNATITNPSIYALEYSFPLGFAGILQPPAGVGTDAHLTYLNSKAALIDEAVACLDKIIDGNFTVTLTSAETSLLDTKVDYADVCLLRAGLRLARATLHLANSYNLSGEYRKVYELYAAGNLTPQAVLAAFPQLFNLSATPAQRSDVRAQIQLAHAEWNKALEAIKTKRPDSEGSVLGPLGENDSTPFLFAFDSIAAAEEVDKQFDALVASLSNQTTLPASANEEFALEGYNLNLSNFVTSTSSPRSLAPTRFDRGFFRPSTWPDPTLGGIFPSASQDDANDAGNFLFLLQPTIYEPYQFWLLAGTPDEWGYFEDGKVLFNEINGIAVDSNGNIYVADQGNHVIRKISIDNKVTTIAGQKWTDWNERQDLQKQYSGYPTHYPSILDEIGPIAVDGNGTVYFMNGGLLSKLTQDGKLSNLAGSFSWSWQDSKDGFGADAVFDSWREHETMAVDKNGNLYLCDINAIRKISPAGQVTTLAGKLGWDDSEGYVDGAGTLARFNDPTGVAVDDTGVVYVMDSDNFAIRKIQPNGTTSTFVGNATISNHFDAKGSKARLNRPQGLTIDSSGNLYFADLGTVRKVKPDGTVTTIAGKLNPEHGAFRLRGQMGIQEAVGEAAIFGEDDVTGLAVDRRGTLYASFENSIYEAESIAAPPSGTPFPTPTPLPTPSTKPTPTPTPSPAPTPELLSLSLSTTTVDLSLGDAEVSYAATASDKIIYVGLSFGTMSWAAPHQSSIKANGSINIPSFTKEGVYNLSSLYYSWGSYPNSQSANFYGDSIPAAFKDISITVINPFSDITAPIVHSVTVLNQEVNTSTSSAKVRYRVQIEDNSSGFNYLSLNYRKADSNGYSHVSNLYDWNASPVAVDGNRNTYEGTIELPQGSAEGDWIFESISVSDKAGNSNFLNLTLEPPAVKFTVNNSAVPSVLPTVSSDQSAPELGALSFSKTSVNVSDSSQEVLITANFKDDLTGIKYSNFVLASPSGNQTIWGDFEEVSGTKNDGIYEARVIIPRYSESGNWSFEYLSVEDEAGQQTHYSDNTGPDYIGYKSLPGSISQKTISVVSNFVDTAGPELNALSVSTSSVNVSSVSQEVTITVNWRDALSGVEYSGIELRSPSGNQTIWSDLEQVSGTTKDGIYEATVVIPRYAEAGEWNLDLWSRDKTGNAGNYSNNTDPYYIGYKVFPVSISQKTISVASSLVDVAGPELTSLSVSKSSLIVSTDSQEVIVTANWKDELSGLQSCGFKFTSPSGNQSVSGHFAEVSGTTSNGTYQGKFVIPPRVEGGEWNLELWAYDELGNSRYYSESTNWSGYTPFPENISETKIALSLAIDPNKNNYAPWPVLLTLDKTSVDVSATDQKVKVQLAINNDDLPTDTSANLVFAINSNFFGNGNSLQVSKFELISGSVANGLYEATIVIPRYTNNGNYTLLYFSIHENNWPYGSKSYNRWGDAIPSEFRKTITVTGTQDVTAPVLQSILVSPTSADTRNGTVSVTANLTITDDLSGLQEKQWSRAGALALRSPSGKEFLYSQFTWVDRISGNSTNGTYQVQFELPQYSEEGAWTIDYIELVDKNYNTRFLIPANLTAQQIAASTIQVQGWPRTWEQQSFTSAASTKGNATMQLSNLSHTFNGTEKVPTVATNPGNLTQNVTLTYNGTTTPPIDPGTYTVVAFMNHAAYQGRQVATMTIGKADQTIVAFSAISNKVNGAAAFAITAPTSSSSLPVTISVKSGPATISANNTVTLTGTGTVVLAANQAGNENYSAAPEVTTQFNVDNPPPPPQAPAPSGGAPSGGGGGGGGEPEKPKKGKKGSDKNDGGDKKSSSKKSGKKDNNDNKSSSKKSEKKSSGGGDSNKSGGKKAKKK
jgi:sugar lactone lactonase YvrE